MTSITLSLSFLDAGIAIVLELLDSQNALLEKLLA